MKPRKRYSDSVQSETLSDAEEVLREISQWQVKDMSRKEIGNKLNYILKKKNANPGTWITDYLSKPSLQRLLESIVDKYIYQEPSKFERIKILAMQVAEEKELSKFNDRTFPCLDKVTLWLYNKQPVEETEPFQPTIVDFESLNTFLMKTLENFMKLLPDLETANQELARAISNGINSLQSHCQQTYDIVFVTILVHPFKDAINDAMSLSELQHLQQCFRQELVKFNDYYAQGNFLHLQVYLFKLAINQSHQPHKLLNEVEEIMKTLKPPIFEEIRQVYHSTSSMNDLIHGLDSLITPKLHEAPAASEYEPSSPLTGYPLLSSVSSEFERKEVDATVLTVAVQETSPLKESRNSVYELNTGSTSPAASVLHVKKKRDKQAHSFFERLGLFEHYPMANLQ